MSGFMFATCDRRRALAFLKRLYPSATLSDTPESAGPLLDLVERDIVRIQDPEYHHPAQVVAGTHWVEDAQRRAEITSICADFHRLATGETE